MIYHTKEAESIQGKLSKCAGLKRNNLKSAQWFATAN